MAGLSPFKKLVAEVLGESFLGVDTEFIPTGMRTPVRDDGALVVNTCSGNDTADVGDLTHWTWSNPTNRALIHHYEDITAVSVECLWQGTKIRQGMVEPDPAILHGNWRAGKGRRPIGAWAGRGKPLITSPGEARRRIYLPAYEDLILHWIRGGASQILGEAAQHQRVYLRDFDTGQGVDRNGPMSHAWVLAQYLNHGMMPG